MAFCFPDSVRLASPSFFYFLMPYSHPSNSSPLHVPTCFLVFFVCYLACMAHGRGRNERPDTIRFRFLSGCQKRSPYTFSAPKSIPRTNQRNQRISQRCNHRLVRVTRGQREWDIMCGRKGGCTQHFEHSSVGLVLFEIYSKTEQGVVGERCKLFIYVTELGGFCYFFIVCSAFFGQNES